MKQAGPGKVRVAFIGAGGMANLAHYPSLHSFDDVEIVAACDLDEKKLHETANKYGISGRYTDYRTMIGETRPDAVYCIGWPHVLFDVWKWCLEQGQNLYIEKPFGLTIHQARALTYLAEKHNCITQVSFQRRSTPLVSHLYQECLKRGPITHAVCRFYKHGIMAMPYAFDNMMGDTVHSIDTLRWICGGEIVKIESATRRIQVPDINLIQATLHFDNGALGILLNSWCSGRRIFDVEIHAPNICVEAEHEGKAYLYADGDAKGQEYDAKEFTGSDQLYVYAGFQAKNREFIDSVKNGTLPSSHFGDAVKTMEAAEIILAQALLDGR